MRSNIDPIDDMAVTHPAPASPTYELGSTPSEVKRYQRQKLTARLSSMILSLAYLAVVALAVGPSINEWLQTWLGDSPWLRLSALAFLYAAGAELLTLPLDFW